jgi:hypothetical protein
MPNVIDDPSRIHSWPYWATRATPAVRNLIGFVIVSFTALAAFLIVASNPDMPGNWGWNVIGHVADPIPAHDYTRSGAIAMAQSGSSLAVATPRDGVVIFSANARVPVKTSSRDVLDVTAGPDPESFYTLESAQGISLLSRGSQNWRSATWLEAPTSPFWKSPRPIQPGDVLFAELDDSGLLIGARGAGIARNRFAGSAEGLRRTRNWQLSDKLSAVDLSQVAGTSKGYWLTLGGGGIRFADRTTLADVSARAVDTPLVKQLSASKRGDWATAVDDKGSSWFFEEGGRWNGPWFDQAGARMASATTVTSARLSDANLWLGATNGLFRYDTARHQMQSILPNVAVDGLEIAGNAVLAATSAGLYVAAGSGARQLDSDRPKDLRVSPSGDTAVYWASDRYTSRASLRAIADPAAGATLVRLQVNGWSSTTQPALRGIIRLGDAAMFATNAGCFIYENKAPSYQDCSSAVAHVPEKTFSLSSFSRISQEDGAVVASADNQLFVLGSGNVWTAIAPANEIGRLTAVSGGVYGLSLQGQLVRFATNGKRELTIGNIAPALDKSSGPFHGDLAGDATKWRLLITTPSSLLQYRSDEGNWTSIPMSFVARQAVLLGDSVAAVTPERSLQTFPGAKERFGSGQLPFAPTVATALSPGRGNTVLVGGPAGRVARYDFNSGSWQSLPAPSAQSGSIVQLEEMYDVLWARSSSGAVFRNVNGSWSAEESVRRWASSPSGTLWTVTATGVTSAQGKGVTVAFGEGDGVQSFVTQARYVWQPDADRAVLVAPGLTGWFDRRNDRWSKLPNAFSELERLIPVNDGLLILDRGRIQLLRQDLQSLRLERSSVAPALDIAMSSNGSGLLWVLEPGAAIEYRVADSAKLVPTGRQASVAEGVRCLRIAACQFDDIFLDQEPVSSATLKYGDLDLVWSFDSSNKVNVRWRNHPELRVWCSSGGRLAVQCARDVWIDTTNAEIALATEAGVLRRSLENYALHSLTGNIRENFDDLRPAATAVAGALEWRLGATGLSASFDQTRLDWTQSNSGWQLNSDIVLRIAATGGNSLVLDTRAGAWAWDSDGGRTTPVSSPAPRSASIETPAIRILLSGDEISLTAFDGRPAIVNGRFFFDDSTDIRGYRGNLYALVAGRAVVRRSNSAPSLIDAAWPLPASSAAVGLSLAAGLNGIRIAGPEGTYELELRPVARTVDPPNWAWLRVQPLSEDVLTGPFAWRRSTTGEWNVAFLDEGQARPIRSWWSQGRFSWDDYLSAGAMDDKRVAVATPVGIAIRRLTGGTERLLQTQPFASSTVARNGSAVIGTLFNGTWLLRTGPQGRPELTLAGRDLDQSVSVTFGPVEHPRLGHGFGFREEWNQTAGHVPALVSKVASVPTAALLDAGRFVFDAPSAAAALPGRRRFTVTGCESSRGCLGATFVDGGGSLMLTAIYALPRKIDLFSASSNGEVFGVAQGARIFRVSSTGVSEASAAQIGDAFDAGHAVQLKTATPAWSKISALKAWDTKARPTADEPGYPIFHAEKEGVAFSFDLLTSIAMDTRRGQLSVGTEGGLFTCPAGVRNSPLLDLAAICQFASHNADGENHDSVLQIRRVRWTFDNKLWIRMGTAAAEWKDASGGTSAGIVVHGLSIQFLPGAVKVGDRSFLQSNDAWWLGRRPFQEIIDASYDDVRDTLWLCDRANGLFALRLGRLSTLAQ